MSQHPEPDAALQNLTGQLDRLDEQLGILVYTTQNPTPVKAVQLTEEADWEAIATWCGGAVHTERDSTDEYFSVLFMPPNADTAITDDWIIQGVTGKFFHRSPEEFAATYTPATNDGPPGAVRDAALKLIRKGYADPGATLAREFDQGPERDETEPVWAWGARAALANLVDAGLLSGATPASQPRVFRPGDAEPGQDVTVVMGQDRHGDRAHLWRRHGIPGLTPTGWVTAEAVIEWSRIFDFHPRLIEVRLPDYAAAVAADEQAIAAGQQVTG